MKPKNVQSQTQYYFDCNATSPVSPEVLSRLGDWALQWGNPSSIHWAGRKPKALLREARGHLAQELAVSPLELIFTSGGSESNATVLKSIFASATKNHFITSAVEHPSVLKTMNALFALGARVDFIPVSKSGFLDLDFFKEKLNYQTALVSVMAANNETGHLFPIAKITELAHQKEALVHTDAVQALGKIPVDLKVWNVDYASFSAHKFYALKGTGLLYAKRGAPLEALILGGGQERHRRGGTENVLGIAAFGHMAGFLNLTIQKQKEIESLRDHFEARVAAEISGVKITGKRAPRLANTSSLVIAAIDGETLLMSLDLQGYAVSTGAACSSGNPEPSPVLLAMGLTREEAQSSLRISLGWGQTLNEVDGFVDVLKAIVFRLRKIQVEKYPQGVSHV